MGKDLKVLIKWCNSKERTNKSTNFKKNFQALNFNIETGTNPLTRTRKMLKINLKRKSEIYLSNSKLSWKKIETLTLKKCLKMQQSSRNFKQRKKKRLETSKKLLLTLLSLITRRSMLLWINIMHPWNHKLLKLSRWERKFRIRDKIMMRLSDRFKVMPNLRKKISWQRTLKIRSKFKKCPLDPKLSFSWLLQNWVIFPQISIN